MISFNFQEVLGIQRLGTHKFGEILMTLAAVRPKCQEFLQQPISRTLREEAQGAMSADSADVYGRILMPQLCWRPGDGRIILWFCQWACDQHVLCSKSLKGPIVPRRACLIMYMRWRWLHMKASRPHMNHIRHPLRDHKISTLLYKSCSWFWDISTEGAIPWRFLHFLHLQVMLQKPQAQI